MNLKYMGCENFDWIHLAQDTDQWWPPVNISLTIRVS